MDDDRLVLEGLERVPVASPAQPAFFYIHLMSTHYLGVQFPGSHVFAPRDDSAAPALEPYETLVRRLDTPDRYDDKVLQADGMIRTLFEALAAKHYLDDAMVVITGDHGEGLGERHFAHGWNLYDEDIRIPMLFYDTQPVRYPDLSFATQIDTRVVTTPGGVRYLTRKVVRYVPVVHKRTVRVNGKTSTVTETRLVPTVKTQTLTNVVTNEQTVTNQNTVVVNHSSTVTQPVTTVETHTVTLPPDTVTETQTQTETVTETETVVETVTQPPDTSTITITIPLP